MTSSKSEQDAHHIIADVTPPLPGLIIRREILDRHRISQAKLARLTGISAVLLHHILYGRNPLSPEFALRLGKVTATDPAYWIDMQSRFSLHQKSREMKETLDNLVELPALADPL